MKAISRMSTTSKVLLAGGAAVGVYFTVRYFTKKEEAPKTTAISPTGQPTGGGLPPATGGQRPPKSPAVPYDESLKAGEPIMVNSYHAQWAAGNLDSQLSAVFGPMPETVSEDEFNAYKKKLVNALTDWAYKDVYGNSVFPIPANWGINPAWQPYVQAWGRMHKQMALLVNNTLEQGNAIA